MVAISWPAVADGEREGEKGRRVSGRGNELMIPLSFFFFFFGPARRLSFLPSSLLPSAAAS